MEERQSKKNRDANRQNKATSIVKASIYSNLVEQGLSCIAKISNDELQNNPNLTEDGKRKFESILSVTDSCLQTNSVACSKFQKCSSYLKTGSAAIAARELNMMNSALKNKENPNLIKSLNYFETEMGDFHATITKNEPNAKCHTSIPIPPDATGAERPQSVNASSSDALSSYQVPTTPTIIPHPKSDEIYHSPYEAVFIVTQYATSDKVYLPDFPPDKRGNYTRKLSKHMIMQYMIERGHVPIRSTAFRKLLNTYLITKTLPANTWTEITAPGRKPHLPDTTLDEVIKDIHCSSEGGKSVHRSRIQATVTKEIKKNWSEHHSSRYKYDQIPTTTMSRYIHRIMSHPSFNIQTTVSNKTESRSSAEWSIRSTISYLVVVLATHFVYAEPSQFHPKLNSIDSSIAEVWKMVKLENNKVLSIEGITNIVETLIPVLPHLVTSTDETTVFITSKMINNKEVWYLYAKPVGNNNTDSSKRDNYSTSLSGDAHCRGLRITLNNTFTAGGRVAPAFVCVYGLSANEMPGDEIVLLPIDGLVCGSDQTGSTEKGYICFIRGKYDPNANEGNENIVSVDEDANENESIETSEDTQPASKESRVAQLYRDTVYYPFIHSIRTNNYRMDENTEEIPTNLSAVCWMDGCYGQLNLLTREEVLKKEAELKIVCNKHSAARTGVEQAADVGPMFKLVKSLLRYMRQLHSCQSPVYQRIVDALDELKAVEANVTKRIVVLESHKRSALISALSKLPSAMGAAFSPRIVTSAFEGNGQIDKIEGLIPSIDGMIGTYRGSIPEGHYLRNGIDIIKKFYPEVYRTGRIDEKSFEDAGVPVDRDSDGNIVSRDFGIQKENCQRAKVLSAKHQRLERIKFIQNMKELETERKIKLYEYEAKKYDINKQCEERLVLAHHRLSNPSTTTTKQMETIISASSLSFADIQPILTIEHFGRNTHKGHTKSVPTNPQLCAFAQVRQKIPKFKGRYPQYKKMNKNKDVNIAECFQLRNVPIFKRIFVHPTGDSANN